MAEDQGADDGRTTEALMLEAREVWEQVAPGYVQHDVRLLDGRLRDWISQGMTPALFREALEIAFTQPGVTKRNALPYAFGIVRRRLSEQPPTA